MACVLFNCVYLAIPNSLGGKGSSHSVLFSGRCVLYIIVYILYMCDLFDLGTLSLQSEMKSLKKTLGYTAVTLYFGVHV